MSRIEDIEAGLYSAYETTTDVAMSGNSNVVSRPSGAETKTYDDLVLVVERLKCDQCFGHGEYDDAEPGDMSFNTFRCGSCKGTGFKNAELYKLLAC